MSEEGPMEPASSRTEIASAASVGVGDARGAAARRLAEGELDWEAQLPILLGVYAHAGLGVG